MADPYDVVPYESRLVPQTSPQHLALCSAWHGGPLPPVREYRALELGCGEGTNLIALAFYQPESSFVGLDSSRSAIERARETVRVLGLTNITFQVRDVQEPPPDAGPFHYILAHGLFSWIPADARAALLCLIESHLAPDGLGFVSYNAQPGWTARGLVRDVLLRSSAVREADLQDKAARAVEVASAFLADMPSPRSTFGALLASELERVVGSESWYLVHEYLTEVNDPFWYGEFGRLLEAAGLQDLADAQFCRPEGQVPPQVVYALGNRDLVSAEREEVVDLLCNRRMRMSVVCRSGAEGCGLSRVDLLSQASFAASLAVCSDTFSMMDGDAEEFMGPGERVVVIGNSIAKAAARVLTDNWPAGLSLEQLRESAREQLKTYGILTAGYSRGRLGDELERLVASGFVDLRLREPVYEMEVPERPEAHALARYEAVRSTSMSSPHHASWAYDEEARALVASLDGTRTVEEVAAGADELRVRQTVETAARYGLLGLPGL